MSRGPKLKTLSNSRKSLEGSIRHSTLKPPVELSKEAETEYQRLLGVLQSGGVLERVDLICVANAARVKALLDKAYTALGDGIDPEAVKLVNILTRQHRGLMRELGVTSLPSRTMFRAKPEGSERDDSSPWGGKLKVS